VSVRAGWRALGSAAAQTFSASFASTMYWSAGVALFKAAVGGPPPPPDDFSMSALPSSLTITAGQSATSSIGVATTSGNPQAVALSASGAPAGVSVSFSPSSVTSGNASTMTVATTASATSGSYTIVVTGAGSATHSTSVGLTVTVASSATPSLVQSAASARPRRW
jgi:aminopeptidase S